MKKIFLIGSLSVLLMACGGADKKEEGKKDNPVAEQKDDLTANPDYQKGLELIAKSDCLTCHKIDEKLTGPSYRDVANKYAGTSDTVVSHLANKIMQGGSGVWGDVMMVPHSSISKEDAEAMVKYILLLKK